MRISACRTAILLAFIGALIAIPAASAATLTFDGTFAPTMPSPIWQTEWGNCYHYINADEAQFGPVVTGGCSTPNPSGSGGRIDLNTHASPTPQTAAGLMYHKGTAYCTTVPFELPRQLPTQLKSGAHVGIAEMKDSSSAHPDWTIQVVTPGGASRLGFAVQTTQVYAGPGPITAGVWHTASVCQNAAGTALTGYFDGVEVVSKATPNMYYDGYANQPLDVSFYTSGAPWNSYDVLHGDPQVVVGTVPPEPAGGWNAP